MNRHPGEEEAASVKAKYKQKLCSYGDSCVTEGCLYFHPYEATESAYNEQEQAYTHEITSAVSLRPYIDKLGRRKRLFVICPKALCWGSSLSACKNGEEWGIRKEAGH